jgi:hypothetical protein
MRQRAASGLLGADGVARIAGLAGTLKVQGGETGQICRAGRIVSRAFLIEGDVRLDSIRRVHLRRRLRNGLMAASGSREKDDCHAELAQRAKASHAYPPHEILSRAARAQDDLESNHFGDAR